MCGRKRINQRNKNNSIKVTQETKHEFTNQAIENFEKAPPQSIEDPYITPNSALAGEIKSPAYANTATRINKNEKTNLSDYENQVIKFSDETTVYQNNTKDVNTFTSVYEKL